MKSKKRKWQRSRDERKKRKWQRSRDERKKRYGVGHRSWVSADVIGATPGRWGYEQGSGNRLATSTRRWGAANES